MSEINDFYLLILFYVDWKDSSQALPRKSKNWREPDRTVTNKTENAAGFRLLFCSHEQNNIGTIELVTGKLRRKLFLKALLENIKINCPDIFEFNN